MSYGSLVHGDELTLDMLLNYDRELLL
jgi:hypothetical protein